MMSPSYIRQLQQEAAATAAAEGLFPFVVWPEDLAQWQAELERGEAPKLPFPNLGDYTPEGWELCEEFFVDSSGLNLYDAGGPALSIAEFIGALRTDRGYALTECGQFQVYVGEFRKVGRHAA